MCAYSVCLAPDDQAMLEHFVKAGNHKAQEIARAWVLIKSGQGKSGKTIAEELDLTPKTVSKIRRRYAEEGLGAALEDKPRPGAPSKLTPEIVSFVTALPCEEPPAGRCSTRIADIQAGLDGRFHVKVGWSTVQRTLAANELRPWKKSTGASPK